MSRRAIPRWAAVALFAAPVALAAPVPRTGDDSVPASAAKLLRHRKVQKELKMTAEQRITLIDALQDIEENHEKQIQVVVKMPNPPGDAFDTLEKDRRNAIEKLSVETAERSLNAGQRTRLRQIDLRLRGMVAFTDARVEKGLQLTDDQKKAAAALAGRLKGMVDQYLDHLGTDDEEKFKIELLSFRKESVKKFADLFTPDQKDAWKALVGEPVTGFDIEELWLKVIEDEDQDPDK
jgi:hypothetical protein